MANIKKNEIGYNEVMSAGTANALMVQYKRANAAPLDITDVFTSLDNALDYAANGATSYAGQIIAVAGENVKTQVYKITSGGTLVELVDAEALAEVVESAGKIAEVKVNDVALDIIDKSVNIDLTSYATQDWVSKEIVSAVTGGQVSLDGFATEKWVEEKGYITANDESVTNKALKSDVEGISSTIETLIGDDTNQSIRQIAKNEVAGIVGAAPETFDTLEEIAAWITSDSAGTEALIGRVAELESDVEVLSGDSHTHENKEVLDGITTDKVTAWDGAQAAAEAYADSLASNYDEAGAAAQALADAKADAAEKYQEKGDYEAAGAAAAVKTWVEEQNYLTEHQDISGLATKDEVAEAVSGMATEAWVKEQNYLTEHQDISGLATKGEVASAQAAAESYADGLASNYDEAGAAATAEQNAKDYVDGKLVDYATQSFVTEQIVSAMTGGEIELTGYAKVEDVKEQIASAKTEAIETASAYTDSEIAKLSDIYAPKADVETLVGSDNGKSVRDIAVEEVASIVSGAPEAFDTLVEIANWITSDSAGTEALIGRVAELEGDVEVLSGASHSHENKEVLDGITADKVTAWDGAQAAAEAYADSLASNYDEAGAAAAVKTWVEEQNYLTEHQDISDLATKGEVASAQAAAESYADGLASNYDEAGAAAQALADAKADAAEKYQEKGDYEAAGAAAAVKTWVEEQNYLTEHQDISDLATKDEVAEAVSGMATEAYVDSKVQVYESGIATEVTEDNKINVLVKESTESQANWLKVKEDNTLAVEEIGLDDAVTTKDIIVEGGQWATAVKTVYTNGIVPSGTSWQSFLESMLCVEKFAGTISTTDNFSVTCAAPGAGITGATNNSSVEVGTKVTLAGVSAKATSASQSITVKTFTYGYKVGENGAHVNNTAYTETLTPTKTAESSDMKEVFTKFTNKDGEALSTITGSNSLDAVEMYVAEGENKVVVSQTGDTYASSTAVTAGTLYVATNLKNYYKTDKKTANTYTPTAKSQEKTANNSSTYTVTGYRNTFYGTTNSTAIADADFIRELPKSGKAIVADDTLTIKTSASDGHIRMVIASPRTIKTVANKTNTQDITVTLSNTHKTVSVPGANDYAPVSYNVYDYTWSSAFGTDEWIITFN